MRPEDEIADMQRALDELGARIIVLSRLHREANSDLAGERRRIHRQRASQIKTAKSENPVRTTHERMKPMFSFEGENLDVKD